MNLKVFKFGGASVKDADHINNVASILSRYKSNKLLVVISAMGKVTNALETHVQDIYEDVTSIESALSSIVDEHLALAGQLKIDTGRLKALYKNFINGVQEDLEKKDPLSFDFVYDQIVSLGELFSTHLVAAWLETQSFNVTVCDAREMIMTDNSYKRPDVDFKTTSKKVNEIIHDKFKEYDLIITQGFIGKSPEGFTTTLGREGSDYTAAILAYCLDAEEVTIWKDVPGILTADPKRFDNVNRIEKMSYQEAIEMTYYGAKVIHPKTIQPIQNKGIRLNVNSYLDPDKIGTVISDTGLLNYPPIVVMEDNVILIQISSNDFSFIQEDHLSYIFNQLNEGKLNLLTMRNSAISFTICIRSPREDRLQYFLTGLGDNFTTDVFRNLQLITIRHFHEDLIKNLTRNKVVLFEEIMKDTIQLVVKPALELKEKI